MKQSDSTERDEIFVIFDKDRKVRGYVLPTARSTDRTAGGLSPGNTRRQKGRSSMKRRVLSFLAGAAAALALTALTATALAASGQVQFNFAGVALNGETKIAAGSDIIAPNGRQIPGSILYVDEAGGKTNYLPIRTISELLGVEVGYDSATRTVLLGEQTVPAAAAAASGPYWHREDDENGVTYASEDPGIDYTEAPGYVLTKLPEGWGLESVRAGMGGRGNLSYRNGSGGRISFSCVLF